MVMKHCTDLSHRLRAEHASVKFVPLHHSDAATLRAYYLYYIYVLVIFLCAYHPLIVICTEKHITVHIRFSCEKVTVLQIQRSSKKKKRPPQHESHVGVEVCGRGVRNQQALHYRCTHFLPKFPAVMWYPLTTSASASAEDKQFKRPKSKKEAWRSWADGNRGEKIHDV